MFITMVLLIILKYWYIVFPAFFVIVNIAGTSARQEANEKINRALHKPY